MNKVQNKESSKNYEVFNITKLKMYNEYSSDLQLFSDGWKNVDEKMELDICVTNHNIWSSVNHLIFSFLFLELMSRGSSVQCLTTGWTIGRSRFDPRQGQRIFLLASASRPALRPTQPPIQWVSGVLSPGVKCGQGVTLTTHPHLVPRLSKSRSYTSSPPTCLHGV
jgi:hypothetical protein